MANESERLLMTPGPTEIPTGVREAMASQPRNPDLEPEFVERYTDVQSKLQTVYDTTDDIAILGGEGILGLEAAVASVVEPGDPVLVLSNGLYGAGFADFVEMYGGEPTVYSEPDDTPLDRDQVKEYLENEEFVAATMVHCETPTGLLNDLDGILADLQAHGVLTIVDAVSSLGGTTVPSVHVDIAVGASQKVFSAPPGLTTVSVSDRAWDRIESVDQPSFYASLAPWQDPELSDPPFFPYTHLASNVAALDEALDRLLEEGLRTVYDRHQSVAERTRELGAEMGLEPYPQDPDRYSPTVTAFEVDVPAMDLHQTVLESENVLLGTGLAEHEQDLIRVGHMGYNASMEKVERTMDAIESALSTLRSG
ncbi:MAG: alanine--glyoxylate aminotransferase family protein [Halodesulfurarchaeum sp.]